MENGVVLHHPPVNDAAAAGLRRIYARIGDRGEVIAQRGSVTGNVVAATAEGVTLTDRGSNYFIPFREIKVFVRSGTVPGQQANQDAQRPAPGEDIRPARRPPPPSMMRRPNDHVEKIQLLGQGAQGQVWKARYASAPSGEFIVVKEMLFPPDQRQQMTKQEQQARRIMQLRHENLIEYLDVRIEQSPAPCVKVLMPHYRESDMLNFLTSLTKPLSEFQVCSLIMQLGSALDYLHTLRPPMVHRDVKLENILMFDGGQRALLMDLDMSREMTARALPGRVTMCGTMEYMAPEVQRFEAGPKSDVWSLGVVLLLLLTLPQQLTLAKPGSGEHLPLNSERWSQRELDAAVNESSAKLRQRFGTQYSRGLVQLCCRMLTHDVRSRYTAEQAVLELQELMVASLTGGRGGSAPQPSRGNVAPAFNTQPQPRYR